MWLWCALRKSCCLRCSRPKDWTLDGLNDSKKLSPKRREAMNEKLQKLIYDKVITFHIVERDNITIDKDGVYPTLKSCYVEIFHKLYTPESLIIIDGNLKFDNLGVDDYDLHSEPKADGKYSAVMAASIIGKTYRDNQMKLLHDKFPQYGWNKNMGYPNPEHLKAIEKYGPCELHRFSYAPMKNIKNTNQVSFKDF